jgi:hypothetical protein
MMTTGWLTASIGAEGVISIVTFIGTLALVVLVWSRARASSLWAEATRAEQLTEQEGATNLRRRKASGMIENVARNAMGSIGNVARRCSICQLTQRGVGTAPAPTQDEWEGVAQGNMIVQTKVLHRDATACAGDACGRPTPSERFGADDLSILSAASHPISLSDDMVDIMCQHQCHHKATPKT